jgi:hypothetical protein
VAVQSQQRDIIDGLAASLEVQSGGVTIDWAGAGRQTCGMDLFDGTWELLYSSAFGSGNLGGSRPGPPNAMTPISLVRSGALRSVANTRVGFLTAQTELQPHAICLLAAFVGTALG